PFLAGELPRHDPFALGRMTEACAAIRAAITAGRPICVHGDYDVDGICATALAVLVLRELGADVSWHLPSRFEEGYGIRGENLARAIAGLRRLATTQRPGLKALMRSAGIDAAAVDEGAVGFRLAPRINAAGRLCRPSAALELLLTDDDEKAGRLAAELETL